MGFKKQRQAEYNQIKVGDTKQSAFDRLGEPRTVEPYFSRPISYCEHDFPPADVAKCVEFITWANGGNWFYCIGVDEEGTVILKAQGHS